MSASPVKSLKRQNGPALGGILIANLAAFAVAIHGTDVLSGAEWRWGDALRGFVPAVGGGLAAALLSSLLSPVAKARIVFMKWRNPLPGARAFSFYARQDDRIDVGTLDRRFAPLPTSSKEQNTLWYKLYRSVESEPSVQDANKQFLLWRDCAAMVLLLAVALVPATLVLTQQVIPAAFLLALFALQFALAVQAARVNGKRLVLNVLALKGAEEATQQ